MKECRPDQIRNPATGRCVKRSGRVGAKVLKNAQDKREENKRKQNKRKQNKRNHGTNMSARCEDDTIPPEAARAVDAFVAAPSHKTEKSMLRILKESVCPYIVPLVLVAVAVGGAAWMQHVSWKGHQQARDDGYRAGQLLTPQQDAAIRSRAEKDEALLHANPVYVENLKKQAEKEVKDKLFVNYVFHVGGGKKKSIERVKTDREFCQGAVDRYYQTLELYDSGFFADKTQKERTKRLYTLMFPNGPRCP